MAEPSSKADRTTALRETLVAVFGLGSPEPSVLSSILSKVQTEDVADVLVDFPDEDKIRIFRALPDDEARGEVIEETDQQSRDEILDGITKDERISVLEEMPVDDLVDHLDELPAEEQAQVLAHLEPEEARDVQELAQFPPETAGGMMTTEFLKLAVGVTSHDALAEIQGNLDAEIISYVYVVDASGVLCGVLSIRDILRAKPATAVRDYMISDLITVRLEEDQEEVAGVANKYNLSVVPVVDDEGRIRGIVTADDILDAVEEEHSEDMLRMAGTVAVHPFYESIVSGMVKRLPFLLVTMLGGIFIILLENYFHELIEVRALGWTISALPLLCGVSGNVAIVSSTVIVRGLATGEINLRRAWKALGHEVAIGTLNGLILSAVVALVVFAVAEYDSPVDHPNEGQAIAFEDSPPSTDDATARRAAPMQVATAILIGMAISVTFAAFLGALIPVACRISGRIDPAIASGPFVTALVDVSASLIFFACVLTIVS